MILHFLFIIVMWNKKESSNIQNNTVAFFYYVWKSISTSGRLISYWIHQTRLINHMICMATIATLEHAHAWRVNLSLARNRLWPHLISSILIVSLSIINLRLFRFGTHPCSTGSSASPPQLVSDKSWGRYVRFC